MWAGRYFTERYYATRYWTKIGTAVEVCVYVQGPRNKFGIRLKYGVCKKYGDGFSDPWFPEIGADVLLDPRYVIEYGETQADQHDATLLSIDNRDELSAEYDTELADESFILQSPNGTNFRVVIRMSSQVIDVEGGSVAPVLTNGSNFQFAVLEEGLYWEPGLPLDPGSLSIAEQLQLLWGLPYTVSEVDPVSGSPVDKFIVSLDGELFKLTIDDDGILVFENGFQTHDAEAVVTPVYTEE